MATITDITLEWPTYDDEIAMGMATVGLSNQTGRFLSLCWARQPGTTNCEPAGDSVDQWLGMSAVEWLELNVDDAAIAISTLVDLIRAQPWLEPGER